MCLKERSSLKRKTQNLDFKEENSSRFYSWGLERTVVLKKVCFIAFFLPPLLGDDGGGVIVGLLIHSYQSNYWQAGYDMGRGVMELYWTCLETCLEQPKPRYLISYIAIWWINSKVREGSMITSEINSVARESSRVIILKSRLNSTGHSASTSEVRDIFDRQTHVPNDRWQLMCSSVLHLWDRRNSMKAPVCNITLFPKIKTHKHGRQLKIVTTDFGRCFQEWKRHLRWCLPILNVWSKMKYN